MNSDHHMAYMRRALTLAAKASENDEVPVGAVIVSQGEVISEAWNARERSFDSTGHAEVIAIRNACAKIMNWRLSDVTLYVTKEPCIMCCGAILNSRIKKVVYGCRDEKGGGAESLYHLLSDQRLNHRVEVVSGICEEESAELLKRFFREKRV